MGEASRSKSKQASEEKPSKIRSTLKKRVDVTPGKHLKKDVKMPKWLKAIVDYFVGSYKELRKVKWPTRRATWGLTLAVLIFTAGVIVFIITIDYGFEQLFKNIIL